MTGVQTCALPIYISKALAANELWLNSTYDCAVGNNLSANNSTGFSYLPGGLCYGNGTFYGIEYLGNFWLATEYSETWAWRISVLNDHSKIDRYYNRNNMGFSIRCLRD